MLKPPEEVDPVVDGEADNGAEDVRLDEAVRELLEVLVVAEVNETDVDVVKLVKGGLVGGTDVSWGRLVVVTTTIVEEIGVDISAAVEVLGVGTSVLVAIETSRVDISGSVDVLREDTIVLVAIEVVRVDISGVV